MQIKSAILTVLTMIGSSAFAQSFTGYPEWGQLNAPTYSLDSTTPQDWFGANKTYISDLARLTFPDGLMLRTIGNTRDESYTHFYGDVYIANGNITGLSVEPEGPDTYHTNLEPLIPDSLSDEGLKYPFTPYCEIKNWNIKEDVETITVASPNQSVAISDVYGSRYNDPQGNEVLNIEGQIPVSDPAIGFVNIVCYAPADGPVSQDSLKALLQKIFGSLATVN